MFNNISVLSSLTLTINAEMNTDEKQKRQNTIKGDQKSCCATVERLEGHNLVNMQNKNRHKNKHKTNTEPIKRRREMVVDLLVPHRFA